MPPVEKTLTDAEAYAGFTEHFPLKITVSSKFQGDHMLAAPNLSKKTSIAAALDRFQRTKKIVPSSWILIDDSTLKAKAKSATKWALIYNSKQQLAAEIKVTRRTVTMMELTKKELQRYEYEEVKIGTEIRYVNCSSAEKEVTIKIMGEWNPLKGEFDLYHYDEKAITRKHDIDKKYLKWIVDSDTGKLMRPAAKS